MDSAVIGLAITNVVTLVLLRQAMAEWEKTIKIAEDEMARSRRYIDELKKVGVW